MATQLPVPIPGNLAWYVASAGLVVILIRGLFADEPAVLDSGAHNHLADLPMWTVGLAVVGAAPSSWQWPAARGSAPTTSP